MTQDKKQVKEFFKQITECEKNNKLVSASDTIQKVELALTNAVSEKYGEGNKVTVDPAKKDITVTVKKSVVAKVNDEIREISLEEAKEFRKSAKLGATMDVPVSISKFEKTISDTVAKVEFFDAFRALAIEKNVPEDYLIDKIRSAIQKAIKNEYGQEDGIVIIEPETATIKIALQKTVVEEVLDPKTEISLADAAKYKSGAIVGSVVEIPLRTKQFGRIAAQAAKHFIRQGISEAEKSNLLREYEDKKCDIVTANVIKVDEERGNVTLEIDNSEVILPKSEQIKDEIIKENSKLLVYVADVQNQPKGPKLMVSRTHPGFIKKLFEKQTPEISDGTVEIKSVSREAGSRTKIAVYSREEDVDPVGACIGQHGSRVNAIVDELGGEKIDVIKYSKEPKEFIAAALSPSDVIDVIILDEEANRCRVIVPDDQLSLAIGNKGQNARLAARLTGWKIDIKSESTADEATEE